MFALAASRKKRLSAVEGVNLGFQIAPMIDVVFVIMLFFMAMAGAVKVERELSQKLPKTEKAGDDINVPEEILVGVGEAGSVTLNEEELDPPTSKAMPNLAATMMRLKQEADTRKAKVLVTIKAEQQAKYERVIDVLDAMTRAQVSNVTFTVGSEDL